MELISTETIKPSSPTPDHLRNYQLFFLDQISPPIFTPLLFFYEKPHEDKDAIFNHLKKSLSDTLTGFYQLAGRIKENLFIECNDGGIPYMQAKVNCEISKVMEELNPGQHNKLLPFKLDEVNDLLLAVQVNFFDCGGIAVAICISHKVGDALSYFLLVNSCRCYGSWGYRYKMAAVRFGPTLPSEKHIWIRTRNRYHKGGSGDQGVCVWASSIAT